MPVRDTAVATDDVVRQYADGASARSLAEQFGVSETCIKNRLRESGLRFGKKTGPKPKPLAERFWALAQIVDDETSCWEFQGSTLPKGYGKFYCQGKPVLAHRMAWELTYGPLAATEKIRHFICDNPPCCRPDHLRKGTGSDNMRDAAAKGRLWMQKDPWACSGDRNGSRTHPERRPRGDNHWKRK